jgi:hypothetical protein
MSDRVASEEGRDDVGAVRLLADSENLTQMRRQRIITKLSHRRAYFYPYDLLTDDLTHWLIGRAIIQTCKEGL